MGNEKRKIKGRQAVEGCKEWHSRWSEHRQVNYFATDFQIEMWELKCDNGRQSYKMYGMARNTIDERALIAWS